MQIFRLTSVFLAGLLLSLSGHAALFRAYLSSAGQPGADCTRAHPCRYLPDALAAVAPGGEIWILDSANFNQSTVNISKSVRILTVPGEVGSIQSIGSAPAIAVYTPGIDVELRNVAISGNAVNPGSYGIYISGASSLTVEDSIIADTADIAVYAAYGARVQVKNSNIRNGHDWAVMADFGAVVDVIGCSLLGNHSGVWSHGMDDAPTIVQVSDTTISNAGTGPAVYAYTNGPGMAATLYVTRSTMTQAYWGLMARGTGAVVEVSGSMIEGAFYNVDVENGGVIRSLHNNHIGIAVMPDVGTLTPLAAR